MANNKGMKSARQKRLAGTIQTRDLIKEQNENAVANSVSFLPGTQIAIPEEITDDYVKDFFKNEINILTPFQLLPQADYQNLLKCVFYCNSLEKFIENLERFQLLMILKNMILLQNYQ